MSLFLKMAARVERELVEQIVILTEERDDLLNDRRCLVNFVRLLSRDEVRAREHVTELQARCTELTERVRELEAK